MVSPIAYFCFNRPEFTKKSIEALLRNKESSKSDLFVFIDADKKGKINKKIKNYFENLKGFKSIKVFCNKKNNGINKQIVYGIGKVFEKYDKVIVVEDDVIVSNQFLDYMNKGLKEHKYCFAVCAYNLPHTLKQNDEDEFFMCQRFSSWGWGIKKDYYFVIKQINNTDLSWDVYLNNSCNYNGWECLHPVNSLTDNIGFGKDNGVRNLEFFPYFGDVNDLVDTDFYCRRLKGWGRIDLFFCKIFNKLKNHFDSKELKR